MPFPRYKFREFRFSKKIVNSFDKIAEKYKEEPQQKTEKKVSVSELARANRIVK